MLLSGTKQIRMEFDLSTNCRKIFFTNKDYFGAKKKNKKGEVYSISFFVSMENEFENLAIVGHFSIVSTSSQERNSVFAQLL